MSPIEQLKRGIETENWADVCAAYQSLTGETLQSKAGDRDAFRTVLERVHRTIGEALGIPAALLTDRKDRRLRPPARKGKEEAEPPRESRGDETEAEGPDENLTEGGVAGQPTVFGDTPRFVTQADISAREIERNRRKARRAAARKEHRPPPRTYEVVCSDCETPFQSLHKTARGVGQRCPKCLKKVARER